MQKTLLLFLIVGSLFSCNSGENKLEIINKPTQSFRDTVVTIYFENKSLEINPKDLDRIKKISQIWSSDSLWFMKVVGFTDTSGYEKTNDLLSEKRANAVFDLIDAQNKIKKELVYITWLGESIDAYDLHFHPVHPQQNCVDIYLSIKNTSR